MISFNFHIKVKKHIYFYNNRCCRSPRGDKLLLAVTSNSGPLLRFVHSATVGISSIGQKMGLRGRRLPDGRLPGSHSLGHIRLYLHVDFRRSISGRQVGKFLYSVHFFQQQRTWPNFSITNFYYLSIFISIFHFWNCQVDFGKIEGSNSLLFPVHN